MAKRENFTAGRIAKFSFTPSERRKSNQTVYWDAKTPGLGLRVTIAGTKAYIFETTLHGKTLRITIGDVRTWTLKQAQDQATALKALTDTGIDPRKIREQQREAAETERKATARSNVSFLSAWDAYVAERKGKWSARHFADHQALMHAGGEKRRRAEGVTKAGALAYFGPLPLSAINQDTVKRWLQKESAERPTQARLAYNRLRAFINWCADSAEYRGIVPGDACKAAIARDVLPKQKAKSDSLQKEQLSAWFESVGKLSNPVISAYLQVLLLTGARREELATLQWPDIDFKWATIHIHDKVEGERTIPLTPYVAYLLANLKRRNDTPPPPFRILHGKAIKNDLSAWKPPQWVFSSPAAKATGGRLVEPRIAHTRALRAAGLPHVSIHGLRRSFGTLAEWVECPTGIAAQIMGHKPSATAEKHYRVRPIDLLRMWHIKIENWILEQAQVTFTKEIKVGFELATVA